LEKVNLHLSSAGSCGRPQPSSSARVGCISLLLRDGEEDEGRGTWCQAHLATFTIATERGVLQVPADEVVDTGLRLAEVAFSGDLT
jgi:hypothetical protein